MRRAAAHADQAIIVHSMDRISERDDLGVGCPSPGPGADQRGREIPGRKLGKRGVRAIEQKVGHGAGGDGGRRGKRGDGPCAGVAVELDSRAGIEHNLVGTAILDVHVDGVAVGVARLSGMERDARNLSQARAIRLHAHDIAGEVDDTRVRFCVARRAVERQARGSGCRVSRWGLAPVGR